MQNYYINNNNLTIGLFDRNLIVYAISEQVFILEFSIQLIDCLLSYCLIFLNRLNDFIKSLSD